MNYWRQRFCRQPADGEVSWQQLGDKGVLFRQPFVGLTTKILPAVITVLPSVFFIIDGKVSALPCVLKNVDGKVSLSSLLFLLMANLALCSSVFFFVDGKVYFAVSFSLLFAIDGKPFLCRLPDEKLTTKTPHDGKLVVSRSGCGGNLNINLR